MALQISLADLPPEPKGKISLADLPPVQAPTFAQKAIAQGLQLQGNINDFGGGVVHGATYPFARALNFAGNALANLPLADHIQVLKSVAHGLQQQHALTAPDYHPQHVAAQIGNVAGQLATPLPEADIGEAAGIASPLIRNLVNRVGTNSALGALYSKPNHALQGALTGAIGGEVLHHGVNGIANSITGIKNLSRGYTNHYLKKIAQDAENHIGTLRTPAEVSHLNSQIGRIPLNFGEAINSPPLAKKLYNEAAVPFSGQKKEGAKLVGTTNKYANDLINELQQGIHPADIPTALQAAVKNNYQEHNGISKALYQTRNEIADEKGVQVPLANFMNAVRGIKTHEGDEWLKTPETKSVNDTAQTLTNGLEQGNGVNYATGKQILKERETPYTQAHFANSNLKKMSRQFEKQQNYHGKGMMDSLSNALDLDMQNAAEKVPGLNEAHQNAQNYFKENILPYRERAISKLMSSKANLSSLNSTLTNSANSKILEDLSPEHKNLLMANMLMKKMEPNAQNALETTPQKLSKGHAGISPEIRARLLSPETENKFGKLKALNDISQEAQTRHSPPNTGFQTAQILKKVAELVGVGGAIKLLGLTPAAAVAGPALALERSRLATKFSPELREAYAQGGYKALPYKSVKSNKLINKGAIIALNKAMNGGGNS